jgi:hypothetical protein
VTISRSHTYATPDLRFQRRNNGKAILQQRWCTEITTEPSHAMEEREQSIRVGPSSREYFWQDVPMVSE